MLDTIVRQMTQKASIEPQKAVTGPGASVMMWGTSVADATRNESRVLRDALTVYRTNRWINRAESVISARVGGAKWHLEDDNGDEVTDESNPALKAIRDMFEKPLRDEMMAKAYPSQPATWRNLAGLTSRHMGLCNVGFWHLDELDRAMNLPKRIFYIRPDRLTPDVNSNGTLTGWRLDAGVDGKGTPLSLEEVLPFYLDQPDKGFYGIGLPESIWSTLAMPSAIDGHALDTLASGGRLPGVYSPKEASGSPDLFDRLSNDLRTIKEMPDAAKRDVVARIPMEFTPTAADMASLNVILLSGMSRDDTLTHWGVPLSTIGGTTPQGLNGGEQRKYDEAALWQNAVQFRIDALRETIQMRLLDRLQATGIYLQLVIEEPAFDDDAPRFETASKALNIAMTDDERRALVNLPPLPNNMGKVIRLPLTLQEVGAAEEDSSAEMGAAKAKPIRPQVDKLLPKIKRDLADFLAEQKKDIAAKVTKNAAHLANAPKDSSVWWSDEWDKKLEKVLKPYASLIADQVAEVATTRLGTRTGKAADFADLAGNNVLARLLKSLGQRIKGINETTREKVSAAIREGVEAGDGAAELGNRVEAAAAFDEYRAELVARTESARVLNESQIESYREFGVERVRAIDGDDDPECSARDGQEFDLEDALAIEDHPNGTLDWAPLVGAA